MPIYSIVRPKMTGSQYLFSRRFWTARIRYRAPNQYTNTDIRALVKVKRIAKTQIRAEALLVFLRQDVLIGFGKLDYYIGVAKFCELGL